MVPKMLRCLLPVVWAHRVFASLSRLTFGSTGAILMFREGAVHLRDEKVWKFRSCPRHPKCRHSFQSGKMVRAALLLVMLEAVITDLVSPSA
jgi:hypothetical protein